MVKLLLGTMMMAGVLGLVACPIVVDSIEALMPQCPTKIMIDTSNNKYSLQSCWIKVGSTVVVEATNAHPLVGDTVSSTNALVTDTKMVDYSFTPSAQDVQKSFGFKCQIHGASGMRGFIYVSNMK